MQEDGNNLTEKWNTYWESHKEIILDKMYPDRVVVKK